jgi:hypothetical protein
MKNRYEYKPIVELIFNSFSELFNAINKEKSSVVLVGSIIKKFFNIINDNNEWLKYNLIVNSLVDYELNVETTIYDRVDKKFIKSFIYMPFNIWYNGRSDLWVIEYDNSYISDDNGEVLIEF